MARPAATGEHKARVARQMRSTAALLDSDHPEMVAGDHLRDAAKVLEHGSTEGAKRHLDAAMFMLTPQSLVRHGILDDDGHADAKHHMHLVNRHRLAVEDIEDIHARNDRLRAVTRARRGEAPTDDDEISEARLIAAARPTGEVIDLRASTAWMRERRDRSGQWVAGAPGFKLSPGDVPGALGYSAAVQRQPALYHSVKGTDLRAGGVFGRHISRQEAMGALGVLGSMNAKSPGRLLIGQLEQRKSLSKGQRKVYDALRRRGRDHYGAFLTASKLGKKAAEMTGSGPAVELAGPYRYKHGWIKLLGAGSATKAAATGAGLPLEARKLPPAHRAVYARLRKRGRSHSKAMAVLGKIGRATGQALNAGSATRAAAQFSSPAVDLAFPWQHELRAPSGRWMTAGESPAASLDGKLAHGVTSGGQQVRGYYDHSRGRVTPRHGGAVPVRFVRPAAGEAPAIQHGKRVKYPRMRHATFGEAFRAVTAGKPMRRTAETANTGPAVELAFNPAEPRDRRGRWRGHGSAHPFGAGVKPGSFEHLKAIEELGDRAGSVPGVPERNSPTMKTSLYHLARSVAQRDMKGAQIHLASAKWANRREAGGIWTGHLAALQHQLAQVPKEETGWQSPVGLPNALMRRFQHPGSYAGGRGVPSNPTKHARRQFVTASMAAPARPAVDLSARTPYLAATPAPRGRPGGPGLYHVQGMGHTAYMQQVVKALIEKRGMKPSKAYAIARASLRKWAARSKHPEVRGAATAAEAGEVARQARAHAHTAAGWEVADVLVELAADHDVIELFNPNHAPPGSAAGGQFAPAGQGQGGKQQRKAVLQRKAAGLRSQIRALEAQLRSINAPHRGRPPAKPLTAKQQAAAAKRAKAAKSAGATPRKKGPPRHAAPTAASLHSQIVALRGQLAAVLAQIRAL